MWLAANSSATIAEGILGVDQAPFIDCIDFSEDRAEDALCGVPLDDVGAMPNYESELYDYIQPLDYQGPFNWLMNDSFFLKEGELDTWRSEAVMTSEGDFQITLHQELAGGKEDFRIAFVIDPNYQPVECIQSGDTCYTLDGEPQLSLIHI